MDWPLIQTGKPADPRIRATMSSGNGLMRRSRPRRKKAGVEILLEHQMTAIYRETPNSGPRASASPSTTTARRSTSARARRSSSRTGGSTGNVNFRRMFDPRLTEEYCGLAGMPWSDQDASGELAGMAIGASLWGFYNQTGEFGYNITKAGRDRHAIRLRQSALDARQPSVRPRARHGPARSRNWQDVILVNMLGKRFYDETGKQFTANDYDSIDALRPRKLSQRQEHQIQSQ